jgi:two-component system sensor histidine kinase UhpB
MQERPLMGIRNWVGNLGLWPRMAFAVSVGFLGLFGAFSILGEQALQEGSDRLLEEQLVIAQMAAAQIDLFLQQSLSELDQARRFADFDPKGASLGEETHVLAHTFGRVEMFAPGVSFLDAQGVVVLSEPPDLYPVGSDLSELHHVALALETRRSVISSPFRNPLTNRPVAAVTVPIFEGTELLGLLSGHIDLRGPAVIDPLERAAEMGHTGHAILVDSEGLTLASTFKMSFLAPGEHASFYRAALSSDHPIVETVILEPAGGSEHPGSRHVMAFASLSKAPWGVAVGGDSDETFAGVRQLRDGLVLLGSTALLVIWAATLLGTRRLVKPVQLLTEAAQRIAENELETPLHVTEGGEIGAMAESLERMRTLLLANIQELASWNETLEDRVADRTQELRRHQVLVQRLLRHAINAQEEERARLARELHDDIGQMLTAVQLNLDHLSTLPLNNAAAHEGQLARTRELTDRALADLRRIIAAVRPGILSELGLLSALEWVADRTLRHAGLSVTIESNLRDGRLPDEVETLLFRIAQEAMGNVARHSHAKQARIELQREDGAVTMTVADDGLGFDPSAVEPDQDLAGGLGLAGMAERAALLGGQVAVESAPGEGTTIRVVVPAPKVESRSDT